MNTNTLLLLILLQDLAFKAYVLYPKVYSMYLYKKLQKSFDENSELHIAIKPKKKKGKQ